MILNVLKHHKVISWQKICFSIKRIGKCKFYLYIYMYVLYIKGQPIFMCRLSDAIFCIFLIGINVFIWLQTIFFFFLHAVLNVWFLYNVHFYLLSLTSCKLFFLIFSYLNYSAQWQNMFLCFLGRFLKDHIKGKWMYK